MVSPISMLFQAMAAPLAGFLYDLQGSYLTIMIISWAVAAIGLVAILLCKPPKPKTELGTKDS